MRRGSVGQMVKRLFRAAQSTSTFPVTSTSLLVSRVIRCAARRMDINEGPQLKAPRSLKGGAFPKRKSLPLIPYRMDGAGDGGLPPSGATNEGRRCTCVEFLRFCAQLVIGRSTTSSLILWLKYQGEYLSGVSISVAPQPQGQHPGRPVEVLSRPVP
ncbi:hypothetical protein T439DRAFT_46811 [Meredithblackwellia eburnea MCA 4105]